MRGGEGEEGEEFWEGNFVRGWGRRGRGALREELLCVGGREEVEELWEGTFVRGWGRRGRGTLREERLCGGGGEEEGERGVLLIKPLLNASRPSTSLACKWFINTDPINYLQPQVERQKINYPHTTYVAAMRIHIYCGLKLIYDAKLLWTQAHL